MEIASCSRRLVVLLITLSTFVPQLAAGGTSRSQDHNVNQLGTVKSSPQPSVAMPNKNVPVYTYEVVNSWPHDPTAFTQGLVFYDGSLYESTGHYGSSTLRRIDLRNGQIIKRVRVSEKCFAEGITLYQGKIYQLTWTENRALVYDLKSLRLESEITYEGEGWGLTNDGSSLIMSDGTNQLRFLDPVTLKTIRTINVKDNDEPLVDLNELEYIKGEIFSNVWKQDRIARIDPHDGRLMGWIDLTGLLPLTDHPGPEDVLNGIAYDEKENRLFVTGKRWPKIFEIRIKLKA